MTFFIWDIISRAYDNSVENDRTGKKFTLVLKTTYKVVPKYQVNTRFPSLCLASGNAIFGGGRRKKEVGKPIGDSVA